MRHLSNIHILVVDDELDSREFATFVLQQAGIIVISVASGSEALDAIAQSVPDLIASDIGMPDMDGYMMMRQIQSVDKTRKLPAIALTAFAGEIDRTAAIAAGFQVHLSKPIEPAEMIKTVAQVYGRKEKDA